MTTATKNSKRQTRTPNGGEETTIFLAALAAKLELPTDVTLLACGMQGLRYGMATVGECADKIIKDYLNGALAERLAGGGNGGAQDRPEKKWCAWCGVWGDHTSGGCDDLHDVLLHRRAEAEKQPNAGTDPTPTNNK
jgi:hypothetical protein